MQTGKSLAPRWPYHLMVAMLVLAVPQTAAAMNLGEKFFINFVALDGNKNGLISRDEFKGDGFAALDTNKDGYLVMWEFALDPAWKRFRMRRGATPVDGNGGASVAYTIGHCDRNSDGKLSADEYPGPPERFQAVDQDGDGFMTVEEVRRSGPPFRAWDSNVDGIVTKQEFKGTADQFAMIDADKNGSLNTMEMRLGLRRAGVRPAGGPRRFRGPVLPRHGGGC